MHSFSNRDDMLGRLNVAGNTLLTAKPISEQRPQEITA